MGISIKPSHKGLLHDEMDVPQGQPIPARRLASEKREAKAEGDTAELKRVVFAQNAKTWKHRYRKVGG